MKKLVTVFIALMFLAISTTAFAIGPKQKRTDPYDVLYHEISLRNLVNGLFLSDNQRSQLLSIARRAKAAYQKMETDTKIYKQEAISAMNGLNKAIRRGAPAPKEYVNKAHVAKEKMMKVYKEGVTRLHSLEDEASKVLTRNQITVVMGFQTCLVPPKSAHNPSPAGAAKDNSAFEKALDALYNVPERHFSRVSERFLTKHIQRTEKIIGPLEPSEIESERGRLLAIIMQARGMDKTEFALNKSALAEDMARPVDDFKQNRENAFDMTRTRWHLGRVGKWLLDPAIIPILDGK